MVTIFNKLAKVNIVLLVKSKITFKTFYFKTTTCYKQLFTTSIAQAHETQISMETVFECLRTSKNEFKVCQELCELISKILTTYFLHKQFQAFFYKCARNVCIYVQRKKQVILVLV